MALKNSTETPKPAAAPASRPTMKLELALYTIYNFQGFQYVKTNPATGQPMVYEFDQNVALNLLARQDMGRAIWKQHRPKPVRRPESNVVKQVDLQVRPVGEPIHGIDTTSTSAPRVIEVGSDDEIADILDRVNADEGEDPGTDPDNSGNITV